VAGEAERERLGCSSGVATQEGASGRWRAEPPDKQRAPGRVLFERGVQKEAEPVSCLPVAVPSPEPHLQTNLRALVITVTRTMP